MASPCRLTAFIDPRTSLSLINNCSLARPTIRRRPVAAKGNEHSQVRANRSDKRSSQRVPPAERRARARLYLLETRSLGGSALIRIGHVRSEHSVCSQGHLSRLSLANSLSGCRQGASDRQAPFRGAGRGDDHSGGGLLCRPFALNRIDDKAFAAIRER